MEETKAVVAPRNMEELIERLNVLLAGDEADVDEIMATMEAYKSNSKDWEKYAHFDPHRYTRNFVDDGNGKYNLLVLAWSEGQASSVHDHAGSHCIMKILDGEVRETLYDPPKDGQPLTATRVMDYKRDQVTYIHDKIGLHRIENVSHSKGALSLHLYSPPFEYCKTFDERTGRCKASPKVTFFSKKGQIVEYRNGASHCSASDK